MTVIFLNKDLEDLYCRRFSRKYKKVPENVVCKLSKAVLYFESAKSIQDIWQIGSLHFEKLANTDKYSIRLDIRWRLEMKIDWTDENCTVGIIGLTDLTKHYGD